MTGEVRNVPFVLSSADCRGTVCGERILLPTDVAHCLHHGIFVCTVAGSVLHL
jgi:hypothetical protein